MRTLRLTVALAALITFSGLGFIGCSSSSAPPPKVEDVTGKWVAIKKQTYAVGGSRQAGFVVEFFNDKTVMLPAGKGNWDILKDGRLKIDLAGMTMFGAIQRDKLIIAMPDNRGSVVFQRQ